VTTRPTYPTTPGARAVPGAFGHPRTDSDVTTAITQFCVHPRPGDGRGCDNLPAAHDGGALGHPFTPDRPRRGHLAPVPPQPQAAEPASAMVDTEPHVRRGAPNELAEPSNPMAVARTLMPALTSQGHPNLRHWRNQWMRWERRQWSEVDDTAVRFLLYSFTEHATYTKRDRKGEPVSVGWSPNRGRITNLMEALAAVVYTDTRVEVPSWLDGAGDVPDASRVIACANGLLDLTSRRLMPLTPLFFNRSSVPFDYDPAAPQPARWLAFLGSIWPTDPEAIAALQEWFGYVLSGRTDLQKMLLVVGPMRSGKGTIARVLTALVGRDNMGGPTMGSLSTNFGLADLPGKSLAVVADARLPRLGADTITERLLTISGEDTIDVDRKFKDPWTGRLPTRFMLLSNELPAFRDQSGAIASRLIILTMTISNLGREDTALERDLMRELPGILRWSLDGLDRLIERGRFAEPASSSAAVALLAEAVSPIKAFLDDWCILGPAEGHHTSKDDLYRAWRDWCQSEGRDHPGTKQMFSRDLFAANVGIEETRPWVGGVRVRCYGGVRLNRPASETGWSGSWSGSGPRG
jgi:putative DNA primase/helicase